MVPEYLNHLYPFASAVAGITLPVMLNASPGEMVFMVVPEGTEFKK